MMRATTLAAARRAATACALLAAACTAPAPTAVAPRDAHTPAARPARLAQLGYGQQAVFMPCQHTDCPQRTRKTVPGSAAAPTPTRPPVPAHPPALVHGRIDGLAAGETAVPVPDTSGSEPPRARTTIVRFPFASAQLAPATRQTLRELAPRLGDARAVRIEGRTDSSGSPAANERLAMQRARAVRDELIALVPSLASRLDVTARGNCCFAVSNDQAEGRALNRRVEITSLHPPQDLP